MSGRHDIAGAAPLSPGESAAWIRASVPPGARTVVIIGTGRGEVLAALDAHAPAIRAVVFEPDPAVARTRPRETPWSDWLAQDRLVLLAGPDYGHASMAARAFGDLSHAPVLVYPALQRWQPVEVAEARLAVRRVTFESSANDGARRASAGRYVLQTLANAPRLAREGDAAALANAAAGTPAIIAAAGPSLDVNRLDLAHVRDRAVLIACDTAAFPLIAATFDPDFIVAADAARANAVHLSMLPPSRSWLVAEGSLHPSAFTHFDGRTFIFKVADHQPWPWLEASGIRRPTLGTWGSVATSALSLALLMGCDPIVFIGADFAFTDGRPYCRGTSFESLWGTWVGVGERYDNIWAAAVNRWPAVMAPDVHGVEARTARHLVSFRDWIVERAAERTGHRIVNATGAGLLAGRSIVQATATETLGAFAPINAAGFHAQVGRLHAATRGDSAGLLRAVAHVLAGKAGGVRDAWTAFTDGSISLEMIDRALHSPEYLAWTSGVSDALLSARTPA